MIIIDIDLLYDIHYLILFLIQMIGAEINDEKSTKSMEIIILMPKILFLMVQRHLQLQNLIKNKIKMSLKFRAEILPLVVLRLHK